MAFNSKDLMAAVQLDGSGECPQDTAPTACPWPSVAVQACGQVTAGCGQVTAPGSCAITLAMETDELGGLPALLQQLHSTLGQPAA